MKNIIIPIIVIISIFGLGFYFGYKNSPKQDTKIENKIDTLWDTLKIDSPVYKKIRSIRVDTDTFYLAGDTVPIHVPIPITQKEYSKDSVYKAWVSGYKQKLDSIIVYPKTIKETKTISITSKFSVGIQVGYGATKVGFSPYIGIGIQYNFISWGK